MTISVVDDAGTRVVSAGGELDAAVVPSLLPQVPSWVAGARGVVLDLSAVDFFDSSGVRLLDQVARACGNAQVAFRVVAPRGSSARRVLEILGMADESVVEDLPTARSAVTGGT